MVGGTVLCRAGGALLLVMDKRNLRYPNREADTRRLSLRIAIDGTHSFVFLGDAVFVSGMHKRSPVTILTTLCNAKGRLDSGTDSRRRYHDMIKVLSQRSQSYCVNFSLRLPFVISSEKSRIILAFDAVLNLFFAVAIVVYSKPVPFRYQNQAIPLR